MATTRDTLKKWFSRGAYPTASQFAAWIDSFFHKDDKIPAASVEGLTDTLNAKASATEVMAIRKQVDKNTASISGLEISAVELSPLVIEVERYTGGQVEFLTPPSTIEINLTSAVFQNRLLFVTGGGASSPASVIWETGENYILLFYGADGRYHEVLFQSQPDELKLISQKAYKDEDFIVEVSSYDADGAVTFTNLSAVERCMNFALSMNKAVTVIGCDGVSHASLARIGGTRFCLSFNGADGRMHDVTFESQPDALYIVQQAAYKLSTASYTNTDYKEI